MKLIHKILLFSLLIVWLSVFIKYESFAASKSGKSDRFRLRSAISGGGSRGSSSSRSSDGSRFRSIFGGSSSSSGSSSDGFRFRSIFGGSSSSSGSSSDGFRFRSIFGGSRVSSSRDNGINRIGEESLYRTKPSTFNNRYTSLSKFKTSHSSASSLFRVLSNKIIRSSSIPRSHHRYNRYNSGYYNTYNYRPAKYNKIEGQVCTNNNSYDGIVFERFICPIEGFELDATHCCGIDGDQYCCNLSESKTYMEHDQHINHSEDVF